MYGSSMHGTTIVAVRRGSQVAMAGDGQVTMDATVVKGSARKVRTVADGAILVGFAGGTADAFTLFDRFEGKVKEFGRRSHARLRGTGTRVALGSPVAPP